MLLKSNNNKNEVEHRMKKILIGALAILAFGANAKETENQSYKLITVSTYLNFYLMNLNACEDFHPSTRAEAYKAEGTLYPYFAKLDAKVANLNIDKDDKKAIQNTVSDRRNKLDKQIADGEFTLEHCNAVIGIVNEGLDDTLLATIK